MNTFSKNNVDLKECYHCGASCESNNIRIEEKHFCCHGCKSVYTILHDNDLCDYYELNNHPGQSINRIARKDKFSYLDDKTVKSKIVQFTDGMSSQATFYLPQIHCSSCLWLLENIYKINDGITQCKVNFTQKEIFIAFDESKTSLRSVVETLTHIGYEPHLSLEGINSKDLKTQDRTRWYKIGVAGFCFGNIMMLSFAEYASNGDLEPTLDLFFKSLSILLSIPVLFYAASEFFTSSYSGLKNGYLNLDFPVALALIITFLRSLYDMYYGFSGGYLDSLSGIVFFMLIGRWLQSRTFNTISFDRDYKSFFPVAIDKIKDNEIIPTELMNLKEGDVIQIHGHEVIPVDGILSKGNAVIDYSFVTGESTPNAIGIGEIIYAGGKQKSGKIELIVTKPVSQSYLTNLWNNPIFHKQKQTSEDIYDIIGKYFTYVVLLLGAAAGCYWYIQDETQLMLNAITTVLIVACPCALLLTKNFTYGNILRIFGQHKFYLRSPEIIDEIRKIKHIVFDKTGTLTKMDTQNISYKGLILSEYQKSLITGLLSQSNHPASKAILKYYNTTNNTQILDYKETSGQGIEGWIDENYIKIGSASFVSTENHVEDKGTTVFVKWNQEVVGYYTITNKYRFGVTGLVSALKDKFTLSLLSGDNDAELQNIRNLLGVEQEILFNQNPQEKLEYIQKLQDKQGKKVMMIGDGLNDSGALKQSHVGISVSDGVNTFTPACDGIIDGDKLTKLSSFIDISHLSKRIIIATFAFASVYNVIGLYYAMQGILHPLIAAILMPSSSITIIFMSYFLVEWLAKNKLKQE